MIELASLAIVATFVIVRASRDPSPKTFLARLAVLAAAAFIGENGVIHAYHFYGYDRAAWTIFVDQVPLLILLIWPVVIHSAYDLARSLASKPLPIALATAGIVLADASLIEPIAVHAGLWRWTEPGLFEVPPIGVLGWAFFAFGAALVIERHILLLLVVPAILANLLLVVTWWGALRWVSAPIPPAAGVATAYVVSLLLAGLALRARDRVPPIDVWLRAPGALFFFVLLVLSPTSPALLAYAIAFAPPYLALTRLSPVLATSALQESAPGKQRAR